MIAALIMAHITAIVRGWLVFLGLARPRPDEDPDTIYRRLSAFLRRPKVRRFVTLAVALELAVGGTWVGVAHGEHLYQLGDRAMGALQGKTIRYVGLCTRNGGLGTVRIAIDRNGAVTSREI
ncbi:hypothetical protein OLX02_19090 [Novosphingobium sp. KCTC 2891]|uniref:hypothetical protein n=1 Tax=Novosphingobium sp. KCTC 2891 TaxID=2989730 RepID=UPI00222134C7|nr:hypothetical protein [Novosphingobium sp. KCTC 2891]MCW1384926.1 hypothetical protein [Novosphingobium sp. KCTC 2891]